MPPPTNGDFVTRAEIQPHLESIQGDLGELKSDFKAMVRISEAQAAQTVEIKMILEQQTQMNARLNNHGDRLRDLEMKMPENLGKRLGSLEVAAPENKKTNGLINEILKGIAMALVLGVMGMLYFNAHENKKNPTTPPAITQPQGEQ